MAGAKRIALGGADQGIYQRGDMFTVIYRDENGRQRSRSARTITEARKLRVQLVADVDAGRHRGVSREKLRDYALEWIDRYQGRNGSFRDDTRADYRRDLHRYVLPQLGGLKLTEVTPRHVAKWVAWLADEKQQDRYLADQTVERIVTILRAMFRTALEEEVVSTNPSRDVRLPKRDEARRIEQGADLDDDEPARALTTDQLAMFLAVTPERYRLLMRLLAATGLRISEALALRWADVTLDGSTPYVHVRRAYRNGKFGPPKSKYGRRKVPLGFELVRALRDHQRATDWPEPMNLVFCTRSGTPYGYSNLFQAAMKPAREEAGVPWAGFHTLRHTCATRLFAAGRNAKQVQHWLGHHSAAFTLDTYIHLLDGDLGQPLPEPVAGAAGAAGAARGQRDTPKQPETMIAA